MHTLEFKNVAGWVKPPPLVYVSPIGISEATRAYREFWVGEAKLTEDGTLVRIDSPIVSAAWEDVFYIEAADRSSGIRVESVGHGFIEDDTVYVKGYLRTNSHDERYIEPVTITPTGSGDITPLGMPNRSIGGGDSLDSVTGFGQRGVLGGFGLNNIGLLVTTWGAFTKLDNSTFTVDDGSGPVKCIVPAGVTLDPAWTYVAVTGISSCEQDGGVLHRLLRVRSAADIVPL